jgi:hypothetical protein
VSTSRQTFIEPLHRQSSSLTSHVRVIAVIPGGSGRRFHIYYVGKFEPTGPSTVPRTGCISRALAMKSRRTGTAAVCTVQEHVYGPSHRTQICDNSNADLGAAIQRYLQLALPQVEVGILNQRIEISF